MISDVLSFDSMKRENNQRIEEIIILKIKLKSKRTEKKKCEKKQLRIIDDMILNQW